MILEIISEFILVPLEYIFNISLSSGFFSELFKRTLVIPIFKRGAKVCSKYHPILITHIIYSIKNIRKVYKNSFV